MDPSEALGRMCKDKVLEKFGVCTMVVDHLFGCRTYTLKKRGQTTETEDEKVIVQEVCLEIMDRAVIADIPVNTYYVPTLLGMEVEDKVTKIRGICISRVFPMVGSPQYIIQTVPKDSDKTPELFCLDEGRISVIENSPNSIQPEEVQGKHKGGSPLIRTNAYHIMAL